MILRITGAYSVVSAFKCGVELHDALEVCVQAHRVTRYGALMAHRRPRRSAASGANLEQRAVGDNDEFWQSCAPTGRQ